MFGICITMTICLSAAWPSSELESDMEAVVRMCIWRPIGYVGVICATIAAGINSVLDAPVMLQQLARDKIVPCWMSPLGFGKPGTDDPVVGYWVVWLATCVFVAATSDSRYLGLVVTQCTLLSYGALCLSAVVGALSGGHAWRPTFRLFHPVVGVFGMLSCIAVGFLVQWTAALIAMACAGFFFAYFRWSKNVEAHWGEYPQALEMNRLVERLKYLTLLGPCPKVYRPQIEFLLSGHFGPMQSQLANLSVYERICVACTSVLTVGQDDGVPGETELLYKRMWRGLGLEQISLLISQAGVGRLRPNVVALPWDPAMVNVPELMSFIGHVFDDNLGVSIARGFEPTTLDGEVCLDVWWWLDDGGLLILLAYLMNDRAPMRLFVPLAADEDPLSRQMRLQRLIKHLRFDAEVTVVPGAEEEPLDVTKEAWAQYGLPETPQVRRWCRLKEMIEAKLDPNSVVLCSLSMPQRMGSPEEYLASLDFISDVCVPFMWTRGNNTNVFSLNL